MGPDGQFLRLVVDRDYEVLGIEADWYRILDDEGYPALFEPECFAVRDASEPSFWVSTLGEDGERYAYPKGWDRPGFFEDFYDKVPAARERFWSVLAELFPVTASRQGPTGRPRAP